MKVKHLIIGLMVLVFATLCVVFYGLWVPILLGAAGFFGFLFTLTVLVEEWDDGKFLNKTIIVTKPKRIKQETLELLAEAVRRRDSQEIERLTKTLERLEKY